MREARRNAYILHLEIERLCARVFKLLIVRYVLELLGYWALSTVYVFMFVQVVAAPHASSRRPALSQRTSPCAPRPRSAACITFAQTFFVQAVVAPLSSSRGLALSRRAPSCAPHVSRCMYHARSIIFKGTRSMIPHLGHSNFRALLVHLSMTSILCLHELHRMRTLGASALPHTHVASCASCSALGPIHLHLPFAAHRTGARRHTSSCALSDPLSMLLEQ